MTKRRRMMSQERRGRAKTNKQGGCLCAKGRSISPAKTTQHYFYLVWRIHTLRMSLWNYNVARFTSSLAHIVLCVELQGVNAQLLM